MQDVVRRLLAVAPMLTDQLDEASLKEAGALLDRLYHPLSEDDVLALLSLLPPGGDTAFGLNWTVLHAVEAAPSWPIWGALQGKGNEWTDRFLIRLKNAGEVPVSL